MGGGGKGAHTSIQSGEGVFYQRRRENKQTRDDVEALKTTLAVIGKRKYGGGGFRVEEGARKLLSLSLSPSLSLSLPLSLSLCTR
jgi:hypothetical protein